MFPDIKNSNPMKKITLILSLLVISLSFTKAQTALGRIWGMTYQGGDSNGGVIFNHDSLTSQDSIVYPFYTPGLSLQYSSLIQATDGNFYGMTFGGGTSGLGTIFKCSTSGMVTTLVSFTGANGSSPYGSLIQASDGNLYGMTNQGGTSGMGTIFKCTTSGTLTSLVSFTGAANGSYPYGNLVQGKDGNLYGMASTGGSSNQGIIFKCSTFGTLNVLVNFNGTNGQNPYGSLIQIANGYFYGMTYGGGSSSDGTLFKCNTTGTLTTLVNFSGTNGQNPYGSLVQASDGNFYGTTFGGGSSSDGTVFKFDSTLHTLSTLVNFAGAANGSFPYSTLIQANDGNLYGMTSGGGSSSLGTMFQCTTVGGLTTYVNFTGANGSSPQGSLVEAADNKLYGMTNSGGPAGYGIIYNCTTSGTFTNIAYIGSSSIGYNPYGGLVQCTDGNLYGMTGYGGTYGAGTIYKYNTVTGTITTIASFNGTNGQLPSGSLIQATDGNLYGMTSAGGTSNLGTIFKCTTSGTLTKLVDFTGTNGESPSGGLIQANDGNLYGMTYQGGASNQGSLFQCTTTGTLTTLVSFSGTNGRFPYGNVIQAKDGNLYGTTGNGGTSNYGTIFQCTLAGSLTTILNFTNTNGRNPKGIIQGSDGNLYGLTQTGGASSNGTIFKCTTSGTLTTLVSFAGASNGAQPYGIIMQASDGNLFGMTETGGSSNFGTVFKCTTSGTLTTLINLNGAANGKSPQYGNLIEVMSSSIVNTATCSGPTLTASVRGAISPYTYSWSTGATTSSIIGVNTAGTYSYTVTDARGIKTSASTTLPAYTTLSVTPGSGEATCAGTPTNLSASGNGGTGALTYTWMPGSLSGSSPSVNPSSTTTYSVTIKDANGCTSNGTQIVTVNPSPTVSISITGLSAMICAGDTLGMIASGASTYAWSPSSGLNATTGVHVIVSSITTTTYSVTGTAAGCTGNASQVITVNPLPTIKVTGTNIITIGSKDTLTASGGISYVWSGGSTSDTTIVTPLTNTTYSVTGKNSKGCSDTATFKVIVNPTGISSIELSNSTSLYPNPVVNTLNLLFDMQETGKNAVVEIIDLTGKELISQSTTISNGKVITIDVSMLAQGMYFAKVLTGKNTQTVKFIKR